MTVTLNEAYDRIYQNYKNNCDLNEPWSLSSYYKARRETYEKVLGKLDECKNNKSLHPYEEVAKLMDFDTQHGKYTDNYFDAMVDTYTICLIVLRNYYEDTDIPQV